MRQPRAARLLAKPRAGSVSERQRRIMARSGAARPADEPGPIARDRLHGRSAQRLFGRRRAAAGRASVIRLSSPRGRSRTSAARSSGVGRWYSTSSEVVLPATPTSQLWCWITQSKKVASTPPCTMPGGPFERERKRHRARRPRSRRPRSRTPGSPGCRRRCRGCGRGRRDARRARRRRPAAPGRRAASASRAALRGRAGRR